MDSVWEQAVHILAAGGKFVLAGVVDRTGSSPAHVGSVMLVLEDGDTLFTVGGGAMEAVAIEEAQALLAVGGWKRLEIDLSGSAAAASGMVCGGTTSILLDCATPADLPVFEEARDCEAGGGRGFLLYRLLPGTRKMVFSDDPEDMEPEWSDSVRLPLRGNGRVFIFGCGHVGMETAHIAAMADFQTVVLDDRAEFANADRFPDSVVMLVDSFTSLPVLGLDADSYVVIVTRGHAHDAAVLDQVLRSEAGYIGMIGSRSKREATYARLMAMGHPAEKLAQVHSPIGLDIGSETPAEIAVSIAAELIQERAKKRR